MTQQRSEAPRLRANLARSGRGLGLAPTSNFLWFDRRANYKKCATVATVALLAVLGCAVKRVHFYTIYSVITYPYDKLCHLHR